MSEKGKTAAIERLRREVGFGCPVCRSPFLTWHHFDPPWHVENHWRPEGIVAMCPYCHADADAKGEHAGAYSVEELRAMKESSSSIEDVKGHFPTWQSKEALLVRIGGCYTDTFSPAISVNGIPQISLGKNATGLLSLSFQLRNKKDEILVKMEDNWLTAYPPNLHDMVVTPKTKNVKIWLEADDVGLELSFKRVTIDELGVLLDMDRQAADKRQAQFFARLPAGQQQLIQDALNEYRQSPRQLPSWLGELPEELREIYLAEDKTAFAVKRWARDNCKMDDGLIPILNFEQMTIHFHGERIMIKDGVADFIVYCAAFENAKGAINLACNCAGCSPQPQLTNHR